jgi:hypothetical protein
LIALFDHEIADEFIGVFPGHPGAFLDIFPFVNLVFLCQYGRDQDAVERAELPFPFVDGGPEAEILGGIFEPDQELFRRPLASPNGKIIAQTCGRGRVGVTIAKNVQAGRLRRVDSGDGLVDFIPIRGIGGFQMGDLEADTGGRRRFHAFIQSFEEVAAFVPHVRGIDAPLLGDDPAKRRQFVGRGEAPRGVLKSG